MEQEEILKPTSKRSGTKKRPIAITVVCVLGFMASASTIRMIFSGIAELIGSWYPPYIGLSSVIALVCMIGLWKMKKWAAYAYTGVTVLHQIVLLSMGVWHIIALLVPGIVIGIAFAYIDKMD